MLWTWQNGDIGKTPGFNGDHVAALRSIKARLIALPAEKDLYFPPEDEKYASQYIAGGELDVIPGVWGHFAGGGANPVDTKYIDDVLKRLLAEDVPQTASRRTKASKPAKSRQARTAGSRARRP
jgi:homoserine O-acetyltransferase